MSGGTLQITLALANTVEVTQEMSQGMQNTTLTNTDQRF
jgi:hypothetical protein